MSSVTAKRPALTGLTAFFSILTAHLASATVPDSKEPQSVVVQYSDLDLSSPKDAQRLYGRIKRAAHIACESPPTDEITRLTQYKGCLDRAIADAVSRVNSSQLSGILQGKTGRRPRD